MKKTITVLCFFLLSSCSSGISQTSKEIETQLKNNNWERIDLAKVGGSWQRVCVFGPYSENNKAEQTLDLKWDLENKTSISSSDGVSVLAFVEGKNVVSYVEHPRNLGDFAKLSGQCFDRANATLARDKTSRDNWISLITER